MVIAFIVGFIELLVFMIFWWSGGLRTMVGIVGPESMDIKVSMLGMVIMWWFIGSVAGIFARAVLSKGLFPETVLWGITLKFLEIIVLVLAGFVNMDLYVFLWLWTGVSFIVYLAMVRWAIKQLSDISLYVKRSDVLYGFRALSKSLVHTFNYFLDQAHTNGVIFLITRYIALAVVPVYTTIRTLTNTLIQITGLVLNPLQPDIIRYHGERSGNKILSVIQVSWLFGGLLVNIPVILMIPYAKWLYELWTNGQLDFSELLFAQLALAVSLGSFGKALMMYIHGVNELTAISIISIWRFIIVFTVSILLIRNWGLGGIGLGLMMAELIGSVILPIYYANRLLGKVSSKMPFQSILLALLPIVVLSICLISTSVAASYSAVVSCGGLGVLVLIYFIQWSRLEVDVRSRLKSAMIGLIKKVTPY
jgi:O-antigen/teichoic acid export membrane protein